MMMSSPSVEIDEAAGIQTRASRKASKPGTSVVGHRRRRGKRMGMRHMRIPQAHQCAELISRTSQ
jgi:hypothetical protein